MKKLILILLITITYISSRAQIGVYKPYRTNGNFMVGDSALFVGKLKIASYTTFSLGGYADKAGQNFGLNITSNRLNVRSNTGTTLEFPTLTEVSSLIGAGSASNLALGTLTSTTIPITNSNGTGFTIPSAVAGVSAGLVSATDQTKLNNTSGTNSGNQTISLSQTNGVALSGSGGTIFLRSLGASSGDFPNADVLPTYTGLFPYVTVTGATNYPFVSGGGFKYVRSGSTGLGYFEFFKEANTPDALYFRTGQNTSTFNAWDIVAGRTWSAGQYVNLTSAQTIAGAKQFTDIVSSGNINVQGQLNANPSTDARAGFAATANSPTSIGALFWGRTSAGGTIFTVSPSGIVTGASFVKSGGTSSQFLKADGSVDANIYGLVTSGSVSSAATLSVDPTKEIQIFSGTTSTWTLPVIAGNIWKKLLIKNRGSGTLTVNSNGGTNTIYSTSAVNTFSLLAGEAVILTNDGTYWNIQ